MNPARRALALLLTINLLSYLDRNILNSLLGRIQEVFHVSKAEAGGLTSVFFISYMLTAPVFGWLADRMSRWVIIGVAVAVWSLASGASGLAGTFTVLLLTRIFLGIGEAGYGPAAPTIIADLYPVERRGEVMAWFYSAIPVGSALGFAFGGVVSHYLGWRWAFYLMTPPGLVLAIWCFFMRDPRQNSTRAKQPSPTLQDYLTLLRIPALLLNIVAQTAFTFALGGLAAWAPDYLTSARGIPEHIAGLVFGGILAFTGLVATLVGGQLGDRWRNKIPGAYFLVSGAGMLLGFPFIIAMLYIPFPYAWICIFLAMFFLFLNTGPSNTALANVSPTRLRATAFALNILVIHALGDVISPPIIGWITTHYGWNTAFSAVSLLMLVSGAVWLGSMKILARDTERESLAEARLSA